MTQENITTMPIVPAEQQDLPGVLALQKLAYQSEAKLLGRQDIPPLMQTAEELEEEWKTGLVLKAEDENGQIVGSVRGRIEGDVSGTLYIGKLIVHPDWQGRGLGTRLLTTMEECYPGALYQLHTGRQSEKNLRLYQKMGYAPFKEETLPSGVALVYLQKEGPYRNQ